MGSLEDECVTLHNLVQRLEQENQMQIHETEQLQQRERDEHQANIHKDLDFHALRSMREHAADVVSQVCHELRSSEEELTRLKAMSICSRSEQQSVASGLEDECVTLCELVRTLQSENQMHNHGV